MENSQLKAKIDLLEKAVENSIQKNIEKSAFRGVQIFTSLSVQDPTLNLKSGIDDISLQPTQYQHALPNENNEFEIGVEETPFVSVQNPFLSVNNKNEEFNLIEKDSSHQAGYLFNFFDNQYV